MKRRGTKSAEGDVITATFVAQEVAPTSHFRFLATIIFSKTTGTGPAEDNDGSQTDLFWIMSGGKGRLQIMAESEFGTRPDLFRDTRHSIRIGIVAQPCQVNSNCNRFWKIVRDLAEQTADRFVGQQTKISRSILFAGEDGAILIQDKRDRFRATPFDPEGIASFIRIFAITRGTHGSISRNSASVMTFTPSC